MVTDVLRGSKNMKLKNMGFEELSTYGIMKDITAKRIRAEIDYLIENGYIAMTDGDYPQLCLSPKSAEILKGGKKLTMKMPREKKPVKKKDENLTADDFLFVELKKLRSEIAKRESVPAYIVFTDAALKDMCRIKPVDIPHFLTVSGVGNAKAEKYGKEFCSCISDYLAGQKVLNS